MTLLEITTEETKGTEETESFFSIVRATVRRPFDRQTRRLSVPSVSSVSSVVILGRRKQGFTLLEVAISVAILAVALTAIFSSEITAMRIASRARKYTVATMLARCKMGELEEELLKEGFSTNDQNGDDECCEGAEIEGFTCEWSVTRIVLPEAELEEEEGAQPGTGGEGEGEEPGETPTLDSLLAGTAGGANPAAGGDLANMAFSYAFPIMKPRIEEQVRRATVEVHWKDGERDRSFDVVQYVVQQPQVQPQQQQGEGT